MWRVPPAVRQSCPNAAENASAARFQTPLDVAESITACRGLEELFRGLAVHLQRVVSFYALGLCLVHPDRGVTSARVLETSGTGFTTLPGYPIDDIPSGWVIETQQPLIVADTAAGEPVAPCHGRAPGARHRQLCILPLTTACRRVGTLGFGSREPVRYSAEEVAFLSEVAKLVAVAVDNTLNFDEARATQRQLSTERDHLRLLLEVANATVSKLELPELVNAVSTSLDRAISHHSVTLALYDNDHGDLVVHAVASKSGDGHRYIGRASRAPRAARRSARNGRSSSTKAT